MFERISRSWRIFKSSLVILNGNRKLLLFPILSTFFLALIAALVLSGIFAFFWANPDTGQKLFESASRPAAAQSHQPNVVHLSTLQQTLVCAGVFIAYFVSAFLATFFNVAFYSEILRGLKGEAVFVTRGFKFALSKSGPIAMWALLAGTVGVVLAQLEERLGWLGQWIIRLIGLAWNVVTIFAVPVIICEQDSLNPIGNLKKSAAIIRNTWGESLIGFVGITVLGGLLSLPVIGGMAILAIVAAMAQAWIVLVMVLGLGVLTIVVIQMLLNVAQRIYIASLYVYATEGVMNSAYDESLARSPFKSKK